MAAARFADGWVRLLRSRPPEILLFGASASHDVKCFSVGQRVMSVPISERSRSALYGPIPSICDRSGPGEMVQRDAQIEARFIDPRLVAGALRRERGRGWGDHRGELSQVRFDGGVARGELPLVGVEEFEILLEDEEMFRPVVPGQGRDDLGFGRMAPMVAVPRQVRRVAVARDDVAEDAQAGDARDVGDDAGEQEVHLHQSLLHALNERGRTFDEGGAVPQIAAQGDHPVSRAEAAPQQAEHVQIAEPLAIRDVTLATGHMFDVPGIHQDDLKAAGLEDLEYRNPVDAGGFHRHMRYATGGEPVGESVQITRKRGERPDGRRVSIRRDGDEVFGRAAINPGGVWM